jgi:dTMP kinase
MRPGRSSSLVSVLSFRRKPATADPGPGPDPAAGEAPTGPLPDVSMAEARTGSTIVRLFGSPGFFRLWLAQVVSATGDWMGFLAVVAIAGRLGGGSGAAAISLVMSARLIPGFFFSPLAGVLVDRWDRRRVMVACDLGRAVVLVSLPFVSSLLGLVIASLLLEVATLLWSPAKEASVPNIVPAGHLTTANSLSLAAAYGTFPVASLLFAFLEKSGNWLGGVHSLTFLRFDQAGSLAIYVDVLTFVASALFISTLVLPPSRRKARDAELGVDFGATFRELREGWSLMFTDPVVRAVMVALGTGLVGGGMVVPLGDVFSRDVLGGGSAGFGLLVSAMGFGMAAGVLGLSALQKRLPKPRIFYLSVLGAGVALFAGASMSTLTPALVCVGVVGLCAGSVYVLGFTILHETVADEMRGRIFSSLYTLVRFCLLLSFAAGPLLADRLDALSAGTIHRHLSFGGGTIDLPGVRLALWLSAVTIVGAGMLAVLSLRSEGEPAQEAARAVDE